MAVIVITGKIPPPPPPTGFGGDFILPVSLFDIGIAGSLRATDDTVTFAVSMSNAGIAGSLRATDDTISMPVTMSNKAIAGTASAAKPGPMETLTVTVATFVGSPDLGFI